MPDTTGGIAENVLRSPHYLIRGALNMPEWASLSIKEAAEQTGYNEEYLRRLIRQGKIEAVKVGQAYLIKAADLERYVAEMRGVDDARAGPKGKGR